MGGGYKNLAILDPSIASILSKIVLFIPYPHIKLA